MRRLIETTFRFQELQTDFKTEIMAGVTTFMTMAYILFVQPAVLSACGMDAGAVFVATCVSSALATILMGVMANYPIAQAPAMGHNFFFAFAAVPMIARSLPEHAVVEPWQVALGAVLISGLIFFILSYTRTLDGLIQAIPASLKNGIAVGIGLLIALVGLQWAGLVVDAPGTLMRLGNLHSPPVLLALFGLVLTASLLALRVRGAILIAILVTAVVGLPFGFTKYQGVISLPPSVAPTFFKLDLLGAIDIGLVSVIFTFFILDFFDTVGTLIGVSEQAGFIKDGKLPRAKEALRADAAGTVMGAFMGTSTITSYIESAAGISAGGRTGFANVVTGILLLLSLLFSPLIKMIGSPLPYTMVMADGARLELQLYPVVAPALIIVGSFMMSAVTRIRWNDPTEALPAFLTIVMMPFSGFSITEGIAFGFISYALVKTLAGRHREVHWLIYACALLFVARYVFMAD
ncbi:MAG: NCS2 family permease [candidate division KSB1 bacterium]|nr:NCS2 family permease [candidate division KSB1 bacterium]MDQ7064468.1 NCS2 family permease [candidate division KSB1 bacterium]